MNCVHLPTCMEAMFGAGCFWGVQSKFDRVDGVLETAVGFSGGNTENPTYEDVCYKNTGHAEVIWIRFDPDVVPYEALLEVFWACHDPTQVNRQGPDIGDQYRSGVYTYSDEQASAARASKKKAKSRFKEPIATEITPAGPFYRAEDYHQKYFEKMGR